MSGAQSISTRRAYGVQRVCRVWARPRSSVYARRQAPRDCARGHRRGPVGAAPDDVLVGHIRRVLEASPFHGEGYRKVWAKLRVEGIRTSPERVRRLIRAHYLQAPHRVGQAHGPTVHNGTITTETPDVMRGTDMTATVTVGEGAACVFVAVDHCTTECIGLHAAKSGNRFEALEPARVSANASAGSATAPPAGGASRPSKTSAWPCSRSSGHTTNNGCSRNTRTEAPRRCDATSSGWTRPRRCEYRQTTVQEPWGGTILPNIVNSVGLVFDILGVVILFFTVSAQGWS